MQCELLSFAFSTEKLLLIEIYTIFIICSLVCVCIGVFVHGSLSFLVDGILILVLKWKIQSHFPDVHSYNHVKSEKVSIIVHMNIQPQNRISGNPSRQKMR